MVPSAATSTETLTEDLPPQLRCKRCELNWRICKSCSRDSSEKVDNYDRMLPRNEPRIMSYVRRWEKSMGFATPLRWISIVFIALIHLATLVWSGTYLYNCRLMKWETAIHTFILIVVAGFGVTGGAHRYWCHRSFKAKWPLQVILLLCYSVAGQNTIYEWVRDHRVHHKFSETSADPHDANRGFFFSHVGWLMMKKHPDVLKRGSKIDMSDISNDPLVAFHTKYFVVFKLACCFVLPMLLPVLLWNESWDLAVLSQIFRYMFVLNVTWSVNSFAHLWGNKPFDRDIMASENWRVSLFALGEGWHNYHHTFPWDYKAAELTYNLNATTFFLDCFAAIGWAYGLKTASQSLVKSVALRKGEIKD